MNTFLIGCLSTLVIIFLIVIVVGMILLVKQFSKIKNLWTETECLGKAISDVNDDWSRNLSEIDRRITQDTDDKLFELTKSTTSNLDSRLDKLFTKVVYIKQEKQE